MKIDKQKKMTTVRISLETRKLLGMLAIYGQTMDELIKVLVSNAVNAIAKAKNDE